MNSCLNCGRPVVNKYCNVACFNAIFWKGKSRTDEEKRKAQQTRKEHRVRHVSNCKTCNKEIEFFTERVASLKKQKQYCSKSCANSRPASDKRKLKISQANKASEKVKAANKILGENKKGMQFNHNRWLNHVSVMKAGVLCAKCGEPLQPSYRKKKYHSDCWRSISGGFRQGSSRGRSGWYKGYWCDSSYELAWVIYQLDHGVEFVRNKEGFHYEFEGKAHKFYPDFIVNDKYIEIKNFSSAQLEAKLKWFPHDIVVLYKKDLTAELEYVRNKYGKDFIKKYDEDAPSPAEMGP